MAAIAIVGVASIARWIFATFYQPSVSQDTGTYLQMADCLADWSSSRCNGQRTPVYPILMILARADWGLVWGVQSGFGIASSFLTYLIVWRVVRRVDVAFAAGLTHALALNQIVFEASIGPESMTAFLLLATCWVAIHFADKGWTVGRAAGLGLMCAICVLSRPLYIVLLPLMLCWILLRDSGRRLVVAVGLIAVFTLPILAWCAFNKATTGYFGMTTLIGYNLSNHSGRVMERAPDTVAQIRDIYVKYRTLRAERGKGHEMTVFEARKELLERTGMTEMQLSRELARISVELFFAHPLPYLRSVAEAWVSFWPVPHVLNRDMVARAGLLAWLDRIWWIERSLLLALNAGLLLIVVPVCAALLLRDRWKYTEWQGLVLLIAIPLAASVMQALLEFGENPRYSVPTQPFVAGAVAGALGLFIARKRWT
ncbi:MAG: hypothetical protein ACREX9_07710 [Gammaproteobacteria bacterium]